MPLDNPHPHHHSLVRGGYSFHFAHRMGFEPATMPRRLRKILLLILVTWVPLVVLSLLNGHAWGHSIVEPLLADPVIYSRFLFVLPLLELAQVVVETSLGVQTRQFLKSGLVPQGEQPEFLMAHDAVIRLRGSVLAEVLIAVLALTFSFVAQVIVSDGPGHSTWERVGGTITPSGWWYILVSLPILAFFLFRWVWIFFLWAWFLFRVSRLEPRANADSSRPRRRPGFPRLGPRKLFSGLDGCLSGDVGRLRPRDHSPGLVTRQFEVPRHGLRGTRNHRGTCPTIFICRPAGAVPV